MLEGGYYEHGNRKRKDSKHKVNKKERKDNPRDEREWKSTKG